jgi:hypothetical protein
LFIGEGCHHNDTKVPKISGEIRPPCFRGIKHTF